MENGLWKKVVDLPKMVIFHSCVQFPEGKTTYSRNHNVESPTRPLKSGLLRLDLTWLLTESWKVWTEGADCQVSQSIAPHTFLCLESLNTTTLQISLFDCDLKSLIVTVGHWLLLFEVPSPQRVMNEVLVFSLTTTPEAFPNMADFSSSKSIFP